MPGDPGYCETQKNMVQILQQLYANQLGFSRVCLSCALTLSDLDYLHSTVSAPGYLISPHSSETHQLMPGTGWGPQLRDKPGRPCRMKEELPFRLGGKQLW